MYAVKLGEYFLKGTTWTSSTERAPKFETTEAAQAGLEKAKQFMARKSDAKKATIITMEG